jgi:hypothetical protein
LLAQPQARVPAKAFAQLWLAMIDGWTMSSFTSTATACRWAASP